MLAAGSPAQQLAEFLAAVADADDERQAVSDAVHRVAEVFEAEVAAFVAGNRVVDVIGFGRQRVPWLRLLDVAAGESASIDVPGAGRCSAVAVPVDAQRRSALVVARSGTAPTAEETSLLRGMARVLSLALRMRRTIEREHRLLEGLRERQRLLEHLGRIERSIAAGRPLQETLDAITRGAAELLGDEVVALRLVEGQAPELMRLVSNVGVDGDLERELRRRPTSEGVAGRAIRENRLVVEEDYRNARDAFPQLVHDGLHAAMAAPVHTNGAVTGCLVVGTRRAGRRYTQPERDTLATFADHVSLALNDAFARHQLDRALDHAVHQAMHDSLTGLPNRLLLHDRLAHALVRSGRLTTTTAVVFVDLDDFKLVNDTLGHAAGDDLLRAVGDRLSALVRPGDTAARLGGDEFAVLFEDITGEDEALAIAERLLPSLSSPFPAGEHDVFVTASVGVAVADPDDTDPGELLRRADLAMYRSKSRGKNRVTLYRREMQEAAHARVSLVSELRRGIGGGELTLHYQPIVRLDDGALAGVEALVRWQHPTRGLLPPLEFVPLAEEHDLITALGDLVLRTASSHVASWSEGGGGTYLSVNLSPRQLLSADAPERVLATIRDAGLEPQRLVLEITESVMLHDAEVTRDRLQRLRDAGVRIAIDDFGTGYSSLAYLTRLPVDVLKIDRAFVAATGRSTGETAVVSAIVHLADTIGLATVAEGIESAAQLAALRELGCGFGQGYHLGEPAPADALGMRRDRRREAGAPVR